MQYPRAPIRFVAALALAMIAAPALAQKSSEIEIRQGVIEQITATQIASNHHRGVGAVVGGLVGLGVGSLVGGGTGRDVAMVVGTIGGALGGNEVQKKHDQPVPAQQVIVRVKSGVLVAVTQPVDARLKHGQKVYIEGSGEGARVVPQ
jgi:outer membrane lipoprotein SlyB